MYETLCMVKIVCRIKKLPALGGTVTLTRFALSRLREATCFGI